MSIDNLCTPFNAGLCWGSNFHQVSAEAHQPRYFVIYWILLNAAARSFLPKLDASFDDTAGTGGGLLAMAFTFFGRPRFQDDTDFGA